MGFPAPSARRWILVEKPPRLRPKASISCFANLVAPLLLSAESFPFLRPCRVLVCSYRSSVYVMELPV